MSLLDNPRKWPEEVVSRTGVYGAMTAGQIRTLHMATRNSKPMMLFYVELVTERYRDDTMMTLVEVRFENGITLVIDPVGKLRDA